MKATLSITILGGISLTRLNFVRAEVLTVRGREPVRWIGLLTTKRAGRTPPARAVETRLPGARNMSNHRMFMALAGNFRSLTNLLFGPIAFGLFQGLVNVAVKLHVFSFR